ncbi:hypothetical protein ALC57_08320, partial [Trachymyrmex cornetzi]
YKKWLQECKTMIEDNERSKQVLVALSINELQKKGKKNYRKKRYWEHPIFKERYNHGFYHEIFPVITLEETRFRNYFRMTPTQFEDLLSLVAPFITKQTVIREPISAAEQLYLTLKFLASGDSMSSISYHYLIGLTTTLSKRHVTSFGLAYKRRYFLLISDLADPLFRSSDCIILGGSRLPTVLIVHTTHINWCLVIFHCLANEIILFLNWPICDTCVQYAMCAIGALPLFSYMYHATI